MKNELTFSGTIGSIARNQSEDQLLYFVTKTESQKKHVEMLKVGLKLSLIAHRQHIDTQKFLPRQPPTHVGSSL